MTLGIHHITAISSDPQDTFDFYTKVLGLRLIKKSVNQDDTTTYHLFFGDEVGSPGMDLTFFPYIGSRPGLHGSGMLHEIMLAVPADSIEFWLNRISDFKLNPSEIQISELGDKYIEFTDWDGQKLQIVETKRINNNAVAVAESDVPKEKSIKNFYGAGLHVEDIEGTTDVLNELGFEALPDSPFTLENPNDTYSNLIFLKESVGQSINGYGTVHHIAFRVKDAAEQKKVSERILGMGLSPTQVIDRFYFKSVYFREPSGVLFELATDGPGFDVDEDIKNLGKNLALPPFLEKNRAHIEASIPKITKTQNIEKKADLYSLFKYYEVDNKQNKTLVLLHGTGADEYDLLPLFNEQIHQKYNIVSLRGNVNENGMLRFFERYSMGNYDTQSIEKEAEKLQKFVKKYTEYSNIQLKDLTFLGFSNGAGMIFSLISLYPKLVKKAVLLHPAKVYETQDKLDLAGLGALVTFGKNDQMISLKESLEVVTALKDAGATVETFDNNAGHQLTPQESEIVYGFLN